MSRKTMLMLVAGLILLGLVIGAALAVPPLLNRPLGPPLALATSSPQTTEAPASTPADTPATEAVCGQSEPMAVLVLLTKEAEPEGARQLLALRLVEVGFPGRTVTSVFFPRELIVTAADLPGGQARLEEVFLQAMLASQDDVAAATSRVAQALYDTFGIESHHYITIDLSGLARTIDAAGGVDVQIQQAYDATALGLPHFQPGPMHMEGELALSYSTATSAAARWDGLRRQTEVLKALKDQVLTPSILPRLPDLMREFRGTVVTDLSLQQGTDFVCLAGEVTADQVTFFGVEAGLVTEQPNGDLLPDAQAIQALLEEVLVIVAP